MTPNFDNLLKEYDEDILDCVKSCMDLYAKKKGINIDKLAPAAREKLWHRCFDACKKRTFRGTKY
jgi:hypothetical protein